MELNYYIKNEDGSIHKMHVAIDIEKFLILRTKIVKECSTYTHHQEYDCFDNIEAKRRQTDDFCNIVVDNNKNKDDLYYVEYDYCRYPYLVSLMDDILTGDVSALNDIINYRKVPNDKIRLFYRMVNDTFTITEIRKISHKTISNVEAFFEESLDIMIDHAQDKQKRLIKNKNRNNIYYYALQR